MRDLVELSRPRLLAAALIAMIGGCGSGGGFPDAPAQQDAARPGSFSVDWMITDGAGTPKTCDQAMATQVIVPALDAHNATFPSTFNCLVGGAVSGALATGAYTFSFKLVGDAGVIATAPTQANLVIQPAMTLHLSPITFVVP